MFYQWLVLCLANDFHMTLSACWYWIHPATHPPTPFIPLTFFFLDMWWWVYTGFKPSSRNGGQNFPRERKDCGTVAQKKGNLWHLFWLVCCSWCVPRKCCGPPIKWTKTLSVFKVTWLLQIRPVVGWSSWPFTQGFRGLQLFSESFKWQLCVFSRNIEVMKQRLKDLWKEGAHICLFPGSTGELAKVWDTHTHTQFWNGSEFSRLPLWRLNQFHKVVCSLAEIAGASPWLLLICHWEHYYLLHSTLQAN